MKTNAVRALKGRGWAVVLNAVAFVLVTVGVVGVTAGYVSAEHTFYTWDFHEYSTRLETAYAQFVSSPLTGLVRVYLSTSQEYNLIPTIPLLPLRAVLDGSRMAYEVNLAAVYIVPFVLAVGWIGSRTIPGPRTAVFWTTVLIVLAIPYTWVSVLRGFADLGAAAIVAAAIGLYVGDQRLTRLWRPLTIGALLAVAFLFRRPFAYDGIAFMAAVGVIILGRAWSNARVDRRSAVGGLAFDASRLTLIALSGAVTLLAFGHRLVGKLLLEDYGALYQSYVREAAEVVGWLGSGFGWLMVILAVAGYVLAHRARTLDRRLSFVGLYGLVLAAEWVFVVGQQDVHYAAHFVVPVAIGLAVLAWSCWHLLPPRAATPALALIVLALAFNAVAGLSPWLPGAGSAARALIAAPNPPLVRADYDEMVRLVGDIRRIGGVDKAVLVMGSTDGFSDDTVRIADDVARGDEAPLFVLESPHVDSRDQYPLAVLIAADIVVAPDPLPLALAPEQQGVQRILHDLFVEGSVVMDGFRTLPSAYAVDGGITVSVLVRVRPTTLPEAQAALAEMRGYTPEVPRNQVPWVSVGGLEAPLINAAADRPSILVTGRDDNGDWVANSLIYVNADASTILTGRVEFLDRTCAGIDLRLTGIGGAVSSPIRTINLVPDGPPTFTVAGLGDSVVDLVIAPNQHDLSRPCPARIVLTDTADDRDEAKSLLLDDEQSGGLP